MHVISNVHCGSCVGGYLPKIIFLFHVDLDRMEFVFCFVHWRHIYMDEGLFVGLFVLNSVKPNWHISRVTRYIIIGVTKSRR